VIATALIAAGVSSGGSTLGGASAKCDDGTVTINGRVWIQYCGPAKATARFSGKTVRFANGHCITRNNVKFLFLGKRPFRGLSPKTKYWSVTTTVGPDGATRKNVVVDWWLGPKHYVVGNLKMTFKNGRKQGTYTGRLLSGGKGPTSGSYSC
jgi:hypothetical protein